MKSDLRQLALVLSVCSLSAVLSACGGGGGGGGGSDGGGSAKGPSALPYDGEKKQADVTLDNVSQVAIDLAGPDSGYVSICTASGAPGRVVAKERLSPVEALDLVSGLNYPRTVAMITVRTSAPADKAGTCGGWLRYLNWSHSSGSTSGTLFYDNYCYTVLTTGDKTTINGEVPFSAPGSPGDFGPVIRKVTAHTPEPLTIVTKTADDTTKASALVAFDNLQIVPGTPGTSGSTTNNSDPDSYTVGSVLVQDSADPTKQYMAQNVKIKLVKTPDGGTKETISGRLYDSTAGYMNITTDTDNPILIDSSGIHTSGTLIVSGSNPSNRGTITIIPTDTPHSPRFTVSLNGIPTGATVDCYNPYTKD